MCLRRVWKGKGDYNPVLNSKTPRITMSRIDNVNLVVTFGSSAHHNGSVGLEIIWDSITRNGDGMVSLPSGVYTDAMPASKPVPALKPVPVPPMSESVVKCPCHDSR